MARIGFGPVVSNRPNNWLFLGSMEFKHAVVFVPSASTTRVPGDAVSWDGM